MGSYLPSTAAQRKEMLGALGLTSVEELYRDVPEDIRFPAMAAGPGASEMEVVAEVAAMAAKNKVFRSIFRGAGAYDHFIPAIVKRETAKEEFVTAYTPYQAEISQGILQSIFEYQTMVCELTGMAAANASVYDGATAAAEAVLMCRDRRHDRVLVSAAAHPAVRSTVKTYCEGVGAPYVEVPMAGGHTDLAALKELLKQGDACFYLQQPNFFGTIEEAAEFGEAAHSVGARFIMGVDPIAAAALSSPAECGADIAVGEGQPLGLPLSFGGPYLGFMACTSELFRKLPGRIVGETTDAGGERCFVLTLQAREQHIRREKASSNICSNQALCAMTAAVYLAAMGPTGLSQVAGLCLSKAHYLAEKLTKLPGFALRFPGEDFFCEFVTTCPVPVETVLAKLEEKGILGGLPVEGGILWCATEKCTKAEMDELVETLKGVVK